MVKLQNQFMREAEGFSGVVLQTAILSLNTERHFYVDRQIKLLTATHGWRFLI